MGSNSRTKTKSADADCSSSSLADAIIDTIRSSSDNGKSMELKLLRKTVLHVTHAHDADDKSTKKLFKSAVQALEGDGRVSVSADGIVKLSKAERNNRDTKKSTNEPTLNDDNHDNEDEPSKKKKEKKKKKDKRKEREENGDDGDPDTTMTASKKLKTSNRKSNEAIPEDHDSNQQPDDIDNISGNNDNDTNNDQAIDDAPDKHEPCKGNPDGITRLFLGNLPFAITDSTLNDHLNSTITHIKWITDKETGRFYGSAFCEVKTSKDAAKAVSKINGSKVMGRPIKINYAPIKPGQENDWPPKQRVITGGKLANNNNASSSGQAGGTGVKAMSIKPEGCCKLFVGNLSYDLDDDGIHKFFMSVDAEIKSVRWLHHKDSGDFKGCGYVDFWNTESCDKAANLNGKNLLGRPIRIDWAE